MRDDIRSLLTEASVIEGRLRAASTGGDNLAAAESIAALVAELGEAAAQLDLADEMMRRSLDFTYGFANDPRGDRSRSMAAMKAYTDRRGIQVRFEDGRGW